MSNQFLVLHLGSNLGDRAGFIRQALQILENKFEKPFLISQIYQTKAWGLENQPDFLNMAAVYQTDIAPESILRMIKTIEEEVGRKTIRKWHEREIDIDIIFYGDIITRGKDLEIPHPFMHERKFVLQPLVEIIPDYVHPVLNKTVKELGEECNDPLEVILWNRA